LNKPFNWLFCQQVKLHDIKDIKAQMDHGVFYLDKEHIQNSQTWEQILETKHATSTSFQKMLSLNNYSGFQKISKMLSLNVSEMLPTTG
jgi:hypothetical protein